MSEENKKRVAEKKRLQRIQDVGSLIMVEDKPDWVYNTPWDDTLGPVKNLANPMLGDQSFTMEALVYCANNHGQRILSWRRYGSGFEWVVPRKDTLKSSYFFTNHQHKNIGKDLELNKWYVLGLQWEVYKDENEVMKVKVRSFINHELDGEDEIAYRPNLNNNQKACIGDISYAAPDGKFEGSIEHVKIWKRIDVGPYAPLKKEEIKEETKEEEVIQMKLERTPSI